MQQTNSYSELIDRYRLRLLSLGQRNRSLKLLKLSARKDIDLNELGYLEEKTTPEMILEKVLAGRRVTLVKSLSAREPKVALADKRLMAIYREVNLIFEETGAYDLAIGYPFAEGRFTEQTPLRAPLLLFPVRLVRQRAGGPRWSLEPRAEGESLLNQTFFRAYEKYNGLRIGAEFWDATPDLGDTLQTLLNNLYAFLKAHQVVLNFNSKLFLQRLEPFHAYTSAYLETFAPGVLKLEPQAVLGIFPQADTALLNDYRVLGEVEEGNFELRKLFSAQPVNELSTKELDKRCPEVERHFVLPVDESQEQALLQAKAGMNLVVDGPPGTGKSQLIVNAAAAALAEGKRVLVVSEKRAALDVVHRRLTGLGLAPHTFLIHDYRNDRAAVYAGLAQKLTMQDNPSITTVESQPDADTIQVDELAERFTQEADALLQVLPCGLTPLELYSQATTKSAVDSTEVAATLARRFTYRSLQAFIEKAKSIGLYAELLAETHPWFYRHTLANLKPMGQQNLMRNLADLPRELADQQQWYSRGHYEGKFILEEDNLPEEIQRFRLLAAELDSNPFLKQDLSALLLSNINPAKELSALTEAAEQVCSLRVLKYDSPLNLEKLLSEYQTFTAASAWSGWLNKAWRAARRTLKVALASLSVAFKAEPIALVMAEARLILNYRALIARLVNEPFFRDLPPSPHEISHFAALKNQSLAFEARYRAFTYLPAYRPKPVLTEAGAAWVKNSWQQTYEQLDLLDAAYAAWHLQWELWAKWLHPEQLKQLRSLVSGEAKSDAWVQALQLSFSKDVAAMVELDTLTEALELPEKDLLKMIRPLLVNKVPDWQEQLMQQFYRAWLEEAEANHPELKYSTGRTYTHDADRLRQLLARRPKAVLAALHLQLMQRLQPLLSKPQVLADISYQVLKKRRFWPLRKFVANFWASGLNELMPLVLASPETVAAIFPLQPNLFDLIILDEASQCPVETALPVLLRGSQYIIAGDEKQLPPLDLFQVRAEEAETDDPLSDDPADTETIAATEAESILQLARRNLTPARLLWHYRSASVELIDFSNRGFYENRLKMIPPARHDLLARPPIRYKNVQGTWLKQANTAECDAVVAEVLALLTNADRPTLGVVTFNYAQQSAILDAFDRAQENLDKTDAELGSKLREEFRRQEGEAFAGLFVKNIENVQGDERDIILFSTAYSPDARGRVRAQFGWLNQLGGENRLNVAITRARRQLNLITSFEPTQLDVTDTLHEGPRLLRSYLEYAKSISQNGSAGLQPERAEVLSAMQVNLGEHLTAVGCELNYNLGPAGFQIDIAVSKPGAQKPPVAVWIENSAHTKASARARIVYAHELLRRQGWQPYYMKRRNWWLSPEDEIQHILALLQS